MGFLRVGQAGLELPTSGDPQAGLELPTSGDPPASASQSAGITGVSHHDWLCFIVLKVYLDSYSYIHSTAPKL